MHAAYLSPDLWQHLGSTDLKSALEEWVYFRYGCCDIINEKKFNCSAQIHVLVRLGFLGCLAVKGPTGPLLGLKDLTIGVLCLLVAMCKHLCEK